MTRWVVPGALLLWVTLGGAAMPAQAKPGGSLKAYQGYMAKTLKLKATGTKHVAGGSATDWYYTYAGKAKSGLPVQLSVQAAGDTVYSQALTITTQVGHKADVDSVVGMAEAFWQEATGGHGKEASKFIARQIAAGNDTGATMYRDAALSLTKVGAGSQLIWVVGAEYRPKTTRGSKP